MILTRFMGTSRRQRRDGSGRFSSGVMIKQTAQVTANTGNDTLVVDRESTADTLEP